MQYFTKMLSKVGKLTGLMIFFCLLVGGFVFSPSALAQDDFDSPNALGVVDIWRVSVASDGTQANSSSWAPSISEDGRYVAFSSAANNLVPNDTNDTSDVFVHDRQTAQTTLVSVASNGTQGNKGSGRPSISADGRYVAFVSWANNLVLGDTNDLDDVFVHDRQTGITTRVSVASDGTEGNGESIFPTISGDGRYVAFISYADNLVSYDTNERNDVFVHDRVTGQTTLVSVASDGTQGDRDSYLDVMLSDAKIGISGDGRYVTFSSLATNLVVGGTDNSQVFVHDRQMGQTTIVSVSSDGTHGNESSWMPSISADGRYVVFQSWAKNLVAGGTNGYHVFVHDREMGQTTHISPFSNQTPVSTVATSMDRRTNNLSIRDSSVVPFG